MKGHAPPGVKGCTSKGRALWKASTSGQATQSCSEGGLGSVRRTGTCGEGSEGYGGFEGAWRQSAKRKKGLCARPQL